MTQLIRVLVFTAVFVLSQVFPAFSQTSQTYRATWVDQSNNEQGFKVYLIAGPLAQWQVKCTVAANVRQCEWSETDQIPKCYAVVAFNAAGDSVPNGPSCIGAPTASSGITVTPIAGAPAAGFP